MTPRCSKISRTASTATNKNDKKTSPTGEAFFAADCSSLRTFIYFFSLRPRFTKSKSHPLFGRSLIALLLLLAPTLYQTKKHRPSGRCFCLEKDYDNESARRILGQCPENLGRPPKSWADGLKTGQPSRATGSGFPKAVKVAHLLFDANELMIGFRNFRPFFRVHTAEKGEDLVNGFKFCLADAVKIAEQFVEQLRLRDSCIGLVLF